MTILTHLYLKHTKNFILQLVHDLFMILLGNGPQDDIGTWNIEHPGAMTVFETYILYFAVTIQHPKIHLCMSKVDANVSLQHFL